MHIPCHTIVSFFTGLKLKQAFKNCLFMSKMIKLQGALDGDVTAI